MTVKVVQKQKPVAKGKAKKQDVLQASAKLTPEEVVKLEAFVLANAALEGQREYIKVETENKKFLSSVASDFTRFPSKEPAKLEGLTATVEFSECGEKREIIDMHGLLTALKDKAGGYEALLSILSVALKDVDRYLSKAEQEPFIKKVTGSRSFTAIHTKE